MLYLDTRGAKDIFVEIFPVITEENTDKYPEGRVHINDIYQTENLKCSWKAENIIMNT